MLSVEFFTQQASIKNLITISHKIFTLHAKC